MADLLDIAPSAAVAAVSVAGISEPIDVRRLNIDEVATLAKLHPSVMAMFATGIDATMLPGQVLAAVIAAGCGHIGDEKAEARVRALLMEDQFKLADAIMGLTFPNGLIPAMQAFENLAHHMVGPVIEPKVVKMRLKASPSPQPPLSDEDSRQSM